MSVKSLACAKQRGICQDGRVFGEVSRRLGPHADDRPIPKGVVFLLFFLSTSGD